MAKTTAPPSASRTPRVRNARRGVDVRGWLGGIRVSGFMVIMLGLVVLAAFVLVPTIGTPASCAMRTPPVLKDLSSNEREIVSSGKMPTSSPRFRAATASR